MVDNRLADDYIFGEMLALYHDLRAENEVLEVEEFLTVHLPSIQAEKDISSEQINSFASKVKDMTWQEIEQAADDKNKEVREAHRKGQIKDYWSEGRGR